MKASQLRASILQQAVEGKLVPQKPEEGTAADLLESIRAEREALIKAGKIKRSKPLPEITEDEILFEIPEGWEWVRLGFASNIIMGQAPNGKSVHQDEHHGIEFHQGKIAFTNEIIAHSGISCSAPTKIAPKDSALFCVRAPIGKVNITDRNVCIGRGLCAVIPCGEMSVRFLLYWLRAYEEIFVLQGTGSTFKAITEEIVMNQPIPLPPLAEQKRIVAKLEELMLLIDAYEKEEEKLSALEKSLPEKLRRSVLQQAVEGKLVPQIAEEGTATELLKEIEKERAELIKAGKMKKAKPLPEISEEEIPFEIPESWEWVRLGDVSDFGVNISVESKDIKDDEWILELGDIEKESGRLIERKKKSERTSISTKHKFSEGDVLYSKLRPYLNKVLVADNDGYCTSEIHVINFGSFIDSHYAKLFLQSPTFVNYADGCSYGMKMPRLGTDDGKNALFSLPPLAEQKRIVAKVEELMQIIDKL